MFRNQPFLVQLSVVTGVIMSAMQAARASGKSIVPLRAYGVGIGTA